MSGALQILPFGWLSYAQPSTYGWFDQIPSAKVQEQTVDVRQIVDMPVPQAFKSLNMTRKNGHLPVRRKSSRILPTRRARSRLLLVPWLMTREFTGMSTCPWSCRRGIQLELDTRRRLYSVLQEGWTKIVWQRKDEFEARHKKLQVISRAQQTSTQQLHNCNRQQQWAGQAEHGR